MIATTDNHYLLAASHTADRILQTLRTYSSKSATAQTPADKLEVAENALSAVGQQALLLHKQL